ncbi:MAG: hypothetical protein RIT81_08220 [Deltaproteobacteria bacterium]
MRLSTLVAGVLGLGLAFACKQETKAPPAAAQAKAPAASQPANAGSGAASSPHGKIEAGPAGAPFSGLVKLGEGLSPDDVKPTDVLFVMARESQGGGLAGRLVAVQRFAPVQLPKAYELGPGNVMVPGIPFTGPFIVTARLDRDGDPMTRGEDDLYATIPEPVKTGTEGQHLVLKKGIAKPVPAPPGAKAPPKMPKPQPVRPASQPGGAASQPH